MLILFLLVVPSPDGTVHLDTNVIEHAADLETWMVGGSIEDSFRENPATTTESTESTRSVAQAPVREVVCKPAEEEGPGFTPTIIFVAGLEVRLTV